jgi:hypothetical protein
MFSIEIDLSGLQVVADKLDRAQAAILQEMPAQLLVIQTMWLQAVQGEQFSGMTKKVVNEEYAASLTDAKSLEYPFNGNAFEGRVVSTKPALAWRVEQGYPSFDMKPGLLAGPRAKRGKQGPYATVPFTHGTAGTVGAKGPPMPPDVSARAQGLPRGGRLTGMGEYGRRSKLTMQANWNKPRGMAGPMMAHPYTWKVSPYEGMVRGGRPGHTTYTTYRRVSGASDPASWIHPGQPPNPVMDAVLRVVGPQVQAAFLRAVQAAVRD